MKYFINAPYTAETLKKEYRELCKKLHPDTGGDAEQFKAMQSEYNELCKNIAGAKNQSAHEYTAEEFAQDMDAMNAAPLRGTRGKTFADLVEQLIKVFTVPDMEKDYNTSGDMSISYGWDGCSLSPLSRTAFFKKFGRQLVELAEMIARAKIKQQQQAEQLTNYAAHEREARRHQAEGCKAPKMGAFVFGCSSGIKAAGRGVFQELEEFAAHPEWFEDREKNSDGTPRREPLYKICEIIEVSTAEFADPTTADRLVKESREAGRDFPGGGATDDPEPADDPRDPYAKYKYYYTECAAVVCRESGRWFLINSEGYDYARYCIMPRNFREIFAAEIAEAQAKEAARKAEQERKEREEKAARFAEYLQKCEKYAGKMEDVRPLYNKVEEMRRAENEAGRAHGYRSPEYKAAGKKTRAAESALMAAQKRNIAAMAATIYPGIKTKVLKADSYRGGFVITYYDGPKLDEFIKNTDFGLFAEYWEEWGYDDYATYHREEFTDFAEKYLASGHKSVTVEREMSEETKQRLTAAILEAVPAAAGVCWENRHPWTREELKAAAAAAGVDPETLCDVYERKHSYFNFVDADTLAAWCFDSLAFEVGQFKAKKAQPQTETQAEPTETTTEPTEATEPAQVTEWTEAPAEGLQLEEIPGGVAVTGNSRTTYKHRKAIKAHGCTWNREAQRWEATNSNDAAKVRAWFMMRDGFDTPEPKTDEEIKTEAAAEISEEENARQFAAAFATIAATMTAAATAQQAKAEQQAQQDTANESQDTATASDEPKADTLEDSGQIMALLEAVADLFRTLSDICKEAKKFEGVTVPAETLRRWRYETEEGTKQAAESFAEVCACLGSLTPESRQQFDALGVIFWTLSEQIRNGYDPATINPATEYARAQLFDLIERTQAPQQAAAVRAAFSPEEYPDYFRKAA